MRVTTFYHSRILALDISENSENIATKSTENCHLPSHSAWQPWYAGHNSL